MTYAIETKNLKKSFINHEKGKRAVTEAVSGVSITVRKGEIFGFLGPNGAGKTTTLRMLTTLLPIDDGEAFVAGFDMKREPHLVRRHIGCVSQLGGADQSASGRENLNLQEKLFGMNHDEARRRSDELLEIFDLSELADRRVKTYSGGQKRRLEVALGIMNRPDVLFLDEPTTGLDPQNRTNLWNQIRKLRDSGTTVFLTTHYLEEADSLADRISIMDHGKIITEGTPQKLKKQVAGDVIIIRPKYYKAEIHKIKSYLDSLDFVLEVHYEGEALHLYVEDGAKAMPQIFDLFDAKKIELDNVSLSQPTLDDVFLKHTGRSLRDTGSGKGDR